MTYRKPLFNNRALSVPLVDLKRGDVIAFNSFSGNPQDKATTSPYVGMIFGLSVSYEQQSDGKYKAVPVGFKVMMLTPYPWEEHVPNDPSHLMINDVPTKQEMGLNAANNYRLSYTLVTVPFERLDQKFKKTGDFTEALSATVFKHALRALGLETEKGNAADDADIEDRIAEDLFTKKHKRHVQQLLKADENPTFQNIPEEAIISASKQLTAYEELYDAVVIASGSTVDDNKMDAYEEQLGRRDNDSRLEFKEKRRQLRDSYRSRFGKRNTPTRKAEEAILTERERVERSIKTLKAAQHIIAGNRDHIPSLITLGKLHSPDVWQKIASDTGIENIQDLYFLDDDKRAALRTFILSQRPGVRLEFLRVCNNFEMDTIGLETSNEYSVLNIAITEEQAVSFREQFPQAFKILEDVIPGQSLEETIAFVRGSQVPQLRNNFARVILAAYYLQAQADGLVSEPPVQEDKPEAKPAFKTASYDIRLKDLGPGRAEKLKNLPISIITGSYASDEDSFDIELDGETVTLVTVRDAHEAFNRLSTQEGPRKRQAEIVGKIAKLESMTLENAKLVYRTINEMYQALESIDEKGPEQSSLARLDRLGFLHLAP